MAHPQASVWILGDQLLDKHPALERAETEYGRDNVHVLLLQSDSRLRKLPYQRKKLVLLLSAMRHYARELEGLGYRVSLIRAQTFRDGLRRHFKEHEFDRLFVMEAANYAGRHFQQTGLEKFSGVRVTRLPNTQFLVGNYDPYPDAEPGRRYVMEYFYRRMRRHFRVLMDDESPAGGAWNFDKENRRPLTFDAHPPGVPKFKQSDIVRDVIEEVNTLDQGTGSTAGFVLAVTREQARAAFDDFMSHRLPEFGIFEDAMSSTHQFLYHSILSPYLNIGLLDPLEMIRRVERAYVRGKVPIQSAEGFIRQVLGWREFMYWQYWRLMPGIAEANEWKASRSVPDFFWTGDIEMRCLCIVIRRAINSGYNHHIERLMILANFFQLAGIAPVEANRWFHTLYVDAYEWVMVPNVFGMGLHADGGMIATKPYIASSNYIHRMSDFCDLCRYDRKKRIGPNACPFNLLYWNFLINNEERLRAIPRSGRSVLNLRHIEQDERDQIQNESATFLESIYSIGGTGETITGAQASLLR